MSRLRKAGWCLVPLLAVVGCGCHLRGQPDLGYEPVPGDEEGTFYVLYRFHCAGCHGADGKLGPAPPLNDPLFLAIVPNGELVRVIRDGRAVTPGQKSLMPAFSLPEDSALSPAQELVWARLRVEGDARPHQRGRVTHTQVLVLAQGIKQRWGPPAARAGSLPPYRVPAGAGAGKKEEGVRTFARACAGCHGKAGEGVESGGQVRRRINDPAFLALISDQALRRYIITGRPDLGMPPYDDMEGRSADFRPLTSGDIDGLVALLASWRQGDSVRGK